MTGLTQHMVQQPGAGQCEYYYNEKGELIPLDKQNEFYNKMWAEENSVQVLETKKKITLAKTTDEKRRLSKILNEKMPAGCWKRKKKGLRAKQIPIKKAIKYIASCTRADSARR